jgi:hypothetical protein
MHKKAAHSNTHQQLNTTCRRTRTQKWPRPFETHGISMSSVLRFKHCVLTDCQYRIMHGGAATCCQQASGTSLSSLPQTALCGVACLSA